MSSSFDGTTHPELNKHFFINIKTDIESEKQISMWCHLPTGFARRQTLRSLVLILLYVAISTTLIFTFVRPAFADINKTLAFQGRLLDANGGIVPDGRYNIQFKIYQGGDGNTAGGGSGSSLEWTEDYVNDNNNEGVSVKNGYFSVYLGSNEPLSDIDWNQDTLWLSMNVAGTSAGCTAFGTSPCEDDGEMLPMRRLTSSPYAMNAGAVGGKTVDQLLQLGQGVQNDTSNNSSIFINKTGTGNLIQLQNNSDDAFTVTSSGDITFGSGSDHTISISNVTDPDTNGANLTINAGAGNGTGSDGNLYLGADNTGEIHIGDETSAATQEITIGTNNTAGSTTNITIGSGSNATAGTTTIQSKDETSISTNGTTRAVFGTDGTLSLGNGASSATPTDFRIQGTASTATGISGSMLSVQGGDATTGDADGGNLHLSGGDGSGTGTNGLVVIDTPAYGSATTQTSGVDVSVTQSNIDSFGVISLKATATDLTFNIPDPTRGANAAGRIIYVTPTDDSYDFSLLMNSGDATEQTTPLKTGSAATLLWNGTSWVIAGASTPSTLQSTYDTTIQGNNDGAELIVGNNQNADGLTIRDSADTPINNTILEVQNSDANNLFSVQSTEGELASNPGVETAGSTSSTVPTNTWSGGNGGTISRVTSPGTYVRTGKASLRIASSAANSGAQNTLTKALEPNTKYTVSTALRLESGSGAFTDFYIAYSVNGSGVDVNCASDLALRTDQWTPISCTFETPSSGITNSNAVLFGQVGAGAHAYYIDDLVASKTSDNLVSDGDATDSGNFATNWTATTEGSVAVTHDTNIGYNDSSSIRVDINTGAENAGVKNKLVTTPEIGKSYKISVQGASDSDFDDMIIRYSPDGGTTFKECTNYNTHSISPISWSELTCTIKTGKDTATDPYLYFVEQNSANRGFYIDGVSMTLQKSTSSKVKVGNNSDASPTLFSVDQSSIAPTADNNSDLLGSMYYDTTLGKVQCYQADGWGNCGDRPDTFVTLSPEYANAVMNGTDTGDIDSGLCSDTLDINDGTDSQPTICGTNETHNFYSWTSDQVTDQTKSIFVTYQLPDNFKNFVENSTSLMSRTDSDDSSVTYQIYRNTDGSGMTACGSPVEASNGIQTTWSSTSASDGDDPYHCDFKPGDSIVFRINLIAKNNANAYVSNLGFTYSSN